MMWLTILVVVLTGFSMLVLALSRAEPPSETRTLSQSSQEEQAVERHSAWLRAVGYTSIALAALLGSMVVVQLVQ